MEFKDEICLLNDYNIISDEQVDTIKLKFKKVLASKQIIIDSKIFLHVQTMYDDQQEESVNDEQEENADDKYNYIIKLVNLEHIPLYRLTLNSEGTITSIMKYIDMRKEFDIIKSNCSLQSFPIKINDCELDYKQYENITLKINDIVHPIEIKYPNIGAHYKYYPLSTTHNIDLKHELSICSMPDKILRLPTYDKDDKYALLLCRYAWGMNLVLAYLDIEKKQIICNNPRNYDHPEPIAIKINSNNIIEYFGCIDYFDLELIYYNAIQTQLPISLDICYGIKSKWHKIDIKN
ncbi:MAG: hypothetical protein Edafosvirus7_5 [Edafosvirus sp.]|uniref:Uncharacterized protein n=1 Tax=Edafosvirus sp. TaxID=2487765 RepID=A0A3G4ZXA4_9VIRU|nr:MAG: hypothetical protein Edafosvirus7_5 [Edafosvirus sp.]